MCTTGSFHHRSTQGWRLPFSLSARRRCGPYAAVLRSFVDLPGITQHGDDRYDHHQIGSDDDNDDDDAEDKCDDGGNAPPASSSTSSSSSSTSSAPLAVGAGQVFSLHNMVRCGMAAHDKLPGEVSMCNLHRFVF